VADESVTRRVEVTAAFFLSHPAEIAALVEEGKTVAVIGEDGEVRLTVSGQNEVLADLNETYGSRRPAPPDDGRTHCLASVPGSAWDIMAKDRDVWKKRALAAEGKLHAVLIELQRQREEGAAETEAAIKRYEEASSG